MHVCLRVCVCVYHVSVGMSVYFVCVCVCALVCVYVRLCVSVHLCISVYVVCLSVCACVLGCVTGYQVIRVIRIFAKTYPFEYYSEKSISEFYLFEITGLCFSIRRYLGIRRQHQQFAHYSNIFLCRYPDMIFN